MEHNDLGINIPTIDGFGELLVRCSELIHGFRGSLRDESMEMICR